MAGSRNLSRLDAVIAQALAQPAPEPALVIAAKLAERFPGAAVFLYGSGITVSAADDPAGVMYDYYVVAPGYKDCFASPVERAAARLLPPNVYYIDAESEYGLLRAKYAVLSLSHLQKLVSGRTFHSYFWARFAQPTRLVIAPEAMGAAANDIVREAVLTFLRRASPLADDRSDWRSVWLAGLRASYKSELRAETGDRAAQLLDHIAGWAENTGKLALAELPAPTDGSRFITRLAWRARVVQGAVLSAARLLKATATFRGGIEYIAWKIERHSGIDLELRAWERHHPFIAAPVVALRYFRMRARQTKHV